jgi:hypothetical protein
VAIRSREASDGEVCPVSTWDMKLGEKPARAARVRTDNCRDSRSRRSTSPSAGSVFGSVGTIQSLLLRLRRNAAAFLRFRPAFL